jgi:hypothetical protein
MNLYPEANERLPYQHQDSNPWGVLQPYINDEARGQGILGQDELVQYDTVYPDTDASYGNNFGDSWQDDSTYAYNSTPLVEERPSRFCHEIQLQVTSSVAVFSFKLNPICCTGIYHQKAILRIWVQLSPQKAILRIWVQLSPPLLL